MECLFDKVTGLQDSNFIKKRLQHMFSCENCYSFKNTYFEEHLRAIASELIKQLIMNGALSKTLIAFLFVIEKYRVWCPQEGCTYLNKPAGASDRFAYDLSVHTRHYIVNYFLSGIVRSLCLNWKNVCTWSLFLRGRFLKVRISKTSIS